MWESLPIQRITHGETYGFISREHEYPAYEDIHVCRWKDVSQNIKQWCLAVWKDEFQCQRNPSDDNDYLFWVPRKATLLAKHGRWIGPDKSKHMVYVCCNYVSPMHRKEGVSGRMILTMAHEFTKKYGPVQFMFELQNIPKSLEDATPFLTFSYIWVPFLARGNKWKPTKNLEFLNGKMGFHANFNGYRAFEYSGRHILFDAHNDIVYYDDYIDLYAFDGMNITGAYCRIFNPFGNVKIFVENMYFRKHPDFTHFVV